MQVILAKTILKKNSNSPCRVVPDTRKLFRNGSTWRLISIVAIAILAFGFALLSGKAFADAEVTFTVNVPDAALLEVELFNTDGTSLGSTASIDVVPSLSSAGFNEKSMVVSVGTSNEYGYNLVMNVSNTALTSGSNTIANLVEDTTNHANGYTCTAATAATCDFTLNSWGFRIDQATALLSATNYIPVPSTLNLNSNSTTTNGDPTYVSFGSRINASQAPGEYTTTITFAATANPIPDQVITFTKDSYVSSIAVLDSNSSTVGTITASGGSLELTPGSAYTIQPSFADGYTTNAIAKTSGEGTLTVNLPNATFVVGEGAATISVTSKQSVCSGYTSMQGLTSSSIVTLLPSSGSTATVCDERDESTYQITNINSVYWMTQNLRYMPTSGTVLYPVTTNVTTQKTLTTVGALTSGNSYTEPRVQYNNDTTYGAYYNYCAASVGTVCSDSTQANATQDICPAGWRLPTQAEMQTIANASGANFNLALAGYYSSGTLSNAGSCGYWWSATASTATGQYVLYYNGSWGVSSLGKGLGSSVRCVFGS